MYKKNSEKKTRNAFILRNPYFLLPIVIILLGLYFFISKFANRGVDQNQLKTKIIPDAVHKILQDDNAKVEVANIKEQSGIYEIELSIDLDGKNPRKYTSYITKDGKILFQSGIRLDLLAEQDIKGAQTQEKTLTCNDLTKTEAPRLTAYIVSNCPYGLQIQRVFKQALAQLPQIASSLQVRYLGSVSDGKVTSMHGEKEAQENLRQICIREEQGTSYWDYVSCYMKEGKTEECLSSAKINTSGLAGCMEDKNRGLKYAQADFDLSDKLSIGSSPTLVLGDSQIVSESSFGGRTPNAIKEIVCCASKNKAEYCQKDISKDNVAASFSKTDEASGENSTSDCGN